MISEDFIFSCNGETLAATIDWNANRDRPTVLSLHGGGPAGKERIDYLTKSIADTGYSVLRFDHSGQGQSTGNLNHSSMKRRLEECLAATEFMDQSKPFTLIGTSMGGPTAMEMTRHGNVENIILFCPALYAARAFDIEFGNGFTDILRSENSFLGTDTSLLENYKGNFFHIIGDRDGTIPAGVTMLYGQHVIQARTKEFSILEECGHQIHDYLKENAIDRDAVLEKILKMIRS